MSYSRSPRALRSMTVGIRGMASRLAGARERARLKSPGTAAEDGAEMLMPRFPRLRLALALAALGAAMLPAVATAEAEPRIAPLTLTRAADGRAVVHAALTLSPSPGRNEVTVIARVFRDEDDQGHATGLVQELRRTLTLPDGPRTTRRLRFPLSRAATRALVRAGAFSGDHGRRHRERTARELYTVTVRHVRDRAGDGSADETQIASADGWVGRTGRAHAALHGAVLTVANQTDRELAIATTPLNCMYDHGEEGSHVSELIGTLAPGASISSYIEDNASLWTLGDTPLEIQANINAWLKKQGAALGLGLQVAGYIGQGFDYLTKVVLVGFATKTCAYTQSLFGILVIDRDTHDWAAGVYRVQGGDPTVLRREVADSGAFTLGWTAPGFRTTLAIQPK